MTVIRQRIEAAGAKLRGSAQGGVDVALQVLDDCNCGTCRHGREVSGDEDSRGCSMLVQSFERVVPRRWFCASWESVD